jgi:DNA polymerase-3 subunit delta'
MANPWNIKDLPWLTPQMEQLRGAAAAGRLGHAILIHEARGAGGDVLALWTAQLILCRATGAAPCEVCAACRRVTNAQHPDLALLAPIEASKQIRIDEVRELIADLALTSHQGGYKVAIISPADALNRNSANALLKTLEEPTPRTLLILVATQPARLPATVLSRCQRIAIHAPERTEAVAWLQRLRGPGDWGAVLEVLGDAPLWAAEVDPKEMAEFAAETRRVLEETGSGQADPLVTAERWWRTDLPLRLLCIENWLTDRIRRHFAAAGFSVEMPTAVHLQRSPQVPNIRRLFGVVDAVHELKASLDTPINRSLALESLLRRLAAG